MEKMKRILIIALLSFVAFAASFAQSQVDFPGFFKADNAQSLTGTPHVWTNYTGSSDDTSDNWISIFPTNIQTKIGLAKEVYLFMVATDSAALDVNVLLRNSSLTSLTSNYADSVIIASNSGGVGIVKLKDATVNRMTIYDQIKVGSVWRTTGTGTTTGRTARWYLMFVL